jgi:hypothetical protein
MLWKVRYARLYELTYPRRFWGDSWSTPIKLENGQLLLPWFPNASEILFTKLELVRVHRGFHHHSSKRLYDVLRRAPPE